MFTPPTPEEEAEIRNNAEWGVYVNSALILRIFALLDRVRDRRAKAKPSPKRSANDVRIRHD